MIQPRFPVEAAVRHELLCGNLRKGACTCLTRLGSCPSFWCILCWKYQNPSWTKLDDETPTRPYIGRTHIVDIVHLCTARLWNEWSSVSYGRLRSGSFYDRRMCGARPPSPSIFLQPAALPTELPGNERFNWKRAHCNKCGWRVKRLFRRRSPRFRLHPMKRPCCPRREPHNASPM